MPRLDYQEIRNAIDAYKSANPDATQQETIKALKISNSSYWRVMNKTTRAKVPRKTKPHYEKLVMPTAPLSRRVTAVVINGDIADITKILEGLR